MSLGDFVKFLLVALRKRGVASSFKYHELWHTLFYRLLRSGESGKPAFFDKMRFDGDGRYPWSPELSEFLHGLCLSGVLRHDALSEEMLMRWSAEFEKLDERAKIFLNYAADIATREFFKRHLSKIS